MIIAVDFDGTLCESQFPDIGVPNTELINWLKGCQKEGVSLILWTCRCDEYLTQAVEWCKEHGLVFDAVNDNLPRIIEKFGTNCRKVVADIYIDDHAAFPCGDSVLRCFRLKR